MLFFQFPAEVPLHGLQDCRQHLFFVFLRSPLILIEWWAKNLQKIPTGISLAKAGVYHYTIEHRFLAYLTNQSARSI